ncbi:hypothetical protein BDN67DRAFT_983393 [Paxillus ammoniavirescens]|nr:hypothetical protein BDN67DRAFT_983393 [Paxillus ammoniavirescens]
MDECISIHNDSGLNDLGNWDFLFTLPYQSTDKSAQLDDDYGGIDPETDEERDIKRGTLLAGKAKGKTNQHVISASQETSRKKDLPDVKTGSKTPSAAIDPIWLDDHPQDQLCYVEITDIPDSPAMEPQAHYDEDDDANDMYAVDVRNRLIENHEDEDLY